MTEPQRAATERNRARRGFVPVGLGGLAVAALAALAANKPLADTVGPAADDAPGDLGSQVGSGVSGELSAELPLAGALALVAVAAWAVLLVLRGGARRALALVVALCSLLAALVLVTHLDPGSSAEVAFDHSEGYTAWYWVAIACTVLTAIGGVLAFLWAPAWPEMGSRYDAPGAQQRAATVDPDDQRSVWKALDEGHDPTDPGDGAGDGAGDGLGGDPPGGRRPGPGDP